MTPWQPYGDAATTAPGLFSWKLAWGFVFGYVRGSKRVFDGLHTSPRSIPLVETANTVIFLFEQGCADSVLDNKKNPPQTKTAAQPNQKWHVWELLETRFMNVRPVAKWFSFSKPSTEIWFAAGKT